MAEVAGDPVTANAPSLLDNYRYRLDTGEHPFMALFWAITDTANAWSDFFGADTPVDTFY